jgi:hypothetical protein
MNYLLMSYPQIDCLPAGELLADELADEISTDELHAEESLVDKLPADEMACKRIT